MPSFVLICTDKPDALDLRMANREAHLAYIRGFGDQILLGGPMVDEAGAMTGSLILLEADDLAAARAFSADDPYAKAGLFAEVAIRPFKATVGKLV